jgi:hypothetical protein
MSATSERSLVAFYATKEQKEKIEKVAQADHRDVSSFLRSLVLPYVESAYAEIEQREREAHAEAA